MISTWIILVWSALAAQLHQEPMSFLLPFRPIQCSDDYECTKKAEVLQSKAREDATKLAQEECTSGIPKMFHANKGEFVSYRVSDISVVGDQLMVTGEISCMLYSD